MNNLYTKDGTGDGVEVSVIKGGDAAVVLTAVSYGGEQEVEVLLTTEQCQDLAAWLTEAAPKPEYVVQPYPSPAFPFSVVHLPTNKAVARCSSQADAKVIAERRNG